jgi:hypothetical protein
MTVADNLSIGDAADGGARTSLIVSPASRVTAILRKTVG